MTGIYIKKEPLPFCNSPFSLAEREGFEPSIPCGIRALQARALDQTTLSLRNDSVLYTIFSKTGNRNGKFEKIYDYFRIRIRIRQGDGIKKLSGIQNIGQFFETGPNNLNYCKSRQQNRKRER